MPVLCVYAIAAYFACRVFRIFQQSEYISHIFRINWHFRRQFSYCLCFCYLFLSGFFTSTIWLPTEWHHPCVRTPVERDGVVGFKQFYTIFSHISFAYLVFMRSAYFFKCRIKLTCLTSVTLTSATSTC